MKKTLLCTLLLYCGLSYGFDGTQTFVTRVGGVAHTLALSNWQVDRKGVPSFDYLYQEKAGTCQFKLSGKVVAGFDLRDGKVELVVFNPEDDHGKEQPGVLMFSDDMVSMSLPEKGQLKKIGLISSGLPPAQRAHACGAGRKERLDLTLHR